MRHAEVMARNMMGKFMHSVSLNNKSSGIMNAQLHEPKIKRDLQKQIHFNVTSFQSET